MSDPVAVQTFIQKWEANALNEAANSKVILIGVVVISLGLSYVYRKMGSVFLGWSMPFITSLFFVLVALSMLGWL